MLFIEAHLSAPPSEVILFRDITLFSNTFLQEKVVLECDKNERDFYYKWLKNKGSWDYVEDFVRPHTETGISIRLEKGTITVDRIIYDNFNLIINKINLIYNSCDKQET